MCVRRLDHRRIGEEQMAPAQPGPFGGEGGAMALQIAPLNEVLVIVLGDRDEHAQDVAEQVAAALGHRVEKHRAAKLGLLEACVGGVEIVSLDKDFGHRFSLRAT